MLKLITGDLFTTQAQTLVNAVNCVGVMGKGLALAFKQRYPAMYKDYAARCKAKQVRLGEPYLHRDPTGPLILNFPTKDHWRSPSRLPDIASGLDYFAEHYKECGIKSIAFPQLGCGLGGLKWVEVGPLMSGKLERLDCEIEAYAPHGA
jgi:O-acetyl-ADP-ribose deacetylase (regulator of RNase III)